jgi:hypothetical protein
VSDSTLGGAVSATSATTAGNLANSRDISVDLTVKNSSFSNITGTVGASDGFLNFSLTTGANGIGKVTWTLPSFVLPSGDNAFSFNIIASALGSLASGSTPNNVAFSFTGTGANAGNNFSLSNTIGAQGFASPGVALDVGLSALQSVALAGGGQLALIFSGGEGWNLALDQFAINSTPANVPVPASAALFGIALVAMRLVGKKSVALKA